MIMEESNIAKIITSEYKLDDLLKKTRIAVYVEARAIFFWILKNKMNLSYGKIGRRYKYNHVTIIYNVNRVYEQMKFDKTFKRKVENILQKVCLN